MYEFTKLNLFGITNVLCVISSRISCRFFGIIESFTFAPYYCPSRVVNLLGEIGFVHPSFVRERFIHRVSDTSTICQFREWHSFCSRRSFVSPWLVSIPLYHFSRIEKEESRIIRTLQRFCCTV